MPVFNDVTLSFMLDYLSSLGVHQNLQLMDLVASVATEQCLRAQQSIPTSTTPINMGPLASAFLFAAVNLDPTNYVTIQTDGGVKGVAKLLPGFGCLIPMASDMIPPYAIANTAACVIDYLVISL